MRGPALLLLATTLTITTVASAQLPITRGILDLWTLTDMRGDVALRYQGDDQAVPDAPETQRDHVDLLKLTIQEPDDDTLILNLTNVAGFQPGAHPVSTFFRAWHIVSFRPPHAPNFLDVGVESYQPAQGADAPLIVERVYACPASGRLGICSEPEVNLTVRGGDSLEISIPKSWLTRSDTMGGLNLRWHDATYEWPVRILGGQTLDAIEVHAYAQQIAITGEQDRGDPTALQLVDDMPDDGDTQTYTLTRPVAASTPGRASYTNIVDTSPSSDTASWSAAAVALTLLGTVVLRRKALRKS